MSTSVYTNMGVPENACETKAAFLLDATLSMRKRGLLKPAIEGTNQVLAALKDAKNHARMEVMILDMNRSLTRDYVMLDSIKELTEADFPPATGSPIADRLGLILDRVNAITDEVLKAAKAHEAQGLAVAVQRPRVFITVATDGVDAMRTDDNRIVRASKQYTDQDVATRLDRFFRADNIARVIAIGDGDDGLQAEAAMICLGFEERHIIRASASAHDIRQAYRELTRASLAYAGG